MWEIKWNSKFSSEWKKNKRKTTTTSTKLHYSLLLFDAVQFSLVSILFFFVVLPLYNEIVPFVLYCFSYFKTFSHRIICRTLYYFYLFFTPFFSCFLLCFFILFLCSNNLNEIAKESKTKGRRKNNFCKNKKIYKANEIKADDKIRKHEKGIAEGRVEIFAKCCTLKLQSRIIRSIDK